jgi:hypothetical protein
MEHRLEVLNSNTPFAMGMGAASLGWFWFITNGISYLSGAEGYFVNEAVAAMLFLQYSMAVNVTRNLPLPGTEVGMDPFYHNRVLTDSVASEAVGFMQWLFKGKKEGDWYQVAKASVNAKWKHPAAHAIRALLVDENLRDWEKIKTRYSSRAYLDHCGKDLIGALVELQKMRKAKYYLWVNYFQDWFPSIRGEERQMLRNVMDEDLEAPINDWLKYLRDACQQIEEEEAAVEAAVLVPGQIMAARPSVAGLWSEATRRRPMQALENSKDQSEEMDQQPRARVVN